MNRINLFLMLILIAGLGFLSYKFTLGFFSDTETSTNNTFQAAAVFASPTPVPPTLKISEVKITGGPSHSNDDFVELYNPTSSDFDLNGHRLVSRSGSSPNDSTMFEWISPTIVPAHKYYLWANSGFASSIGADASSTDNLGANNSIALRFGAEDTGTIIDALSWNSSSQSLKEGTEFSPDLGTNQSMERKALSTSTQATMEGGADAAKGNGFDAGNNATDFILRLVSQPQNSSSAAESP